MFFPVHCRGLSVLFFPFSSTSNQWRHPQPWRSLVFNRKLALACAVHQGLSDYWCSCSNIVGFSPCSISALPQLLCCCGAIKNALGLLIKARAISYSSVLQVTLTDWHNRACRVGTPAATPRLQFCIISATCPDVLGHFDNTWPTQLKVPKVAWLRGSVFGSGTFFFIESKKWCLKTLNTQKEIIF